MAKQTINVGSSANDGTGDPNRTAFQKINSNFTELYDAIPTPVQQYKFLLSQTGGDDPQTATSGTLTQGVTYEIVVFETGDNFIPSGAPNNTVGTKWIANGVAPSWGNGSEIGFNNGAPFVYEGINTIGYVWWERADDGYYQLKSNGLFIGKVFIYPSSFAGFASFFETIIDGAPDNLNFYSSTINYLTNSQTRADNLFNAQAYIIELY